MASPTQIYTLAKAIIDRYGPDAEEYAAAMLRLRLEDDDLPGAGAWLAIGSAIDDLERLPPPGRRH